jgi:hypothetical protein
MPDEGFWVTVVVLDKAADGLFEFFGGAVDKLQWNQLLEL